MALDVGTLGASPVNVVRHADPITGEQRIVLVRQAIDGLRALIDGVDVGRSGQRRSRGIDRLRVRPHGHGTRRSEAVDRQELAVERHLVEPVAALIRRDDPHRFRIERPCGRLDPIIEIGCDAMRRAARPVVEPQLPKIGFVAGARLRAVRDPAAVRRIVRRCVRAHARGDAFRGTSGNRNNEEIGVRRELGMLRRVLREDELFAVRRDVEFVAASDRERRRVERAWREVARSPAVQRHINNVAARRLLPRFPVAIEQPGQHARFRRRAPRGGRLVLDARRIDAAIGIDIGDNDNARTVRNPFDRARAAGKIAHFARGAGRDVV